MRTMAGSESSTEGAFFGNHDREQRCSLSDLDWFYEDPARVSRYAGQWVAVLNRTIVGYGSALQASSAANHALVFYVDRPEERNRAEIGL